jgi:hypothetical protein
MASTSRKPDPFTLVLSRYLCPVSLCFRAAMRAWGHSFRGNGDISLLFMVAAVAAMAAVIVRRFSDPFSSYAFGCAVGLYTAVDVALIIYHPTPPGPSTSLYIVLVFLLSPAPLVLDALFMANASRLRAEAAERVASRP